MTAKPNTFPVVNPQHLALLDTIAAVAAAVAVVDGVAITARGIAQLLR